MVATLHGNGQFFIDRHRGAYMYLYFLCHFVTNAEVECFLDVIGDGVIDGVPGAFDRGRRNDAAKRDYRNVCRAAADVYYHVPTCFVNGNARADRSKNGLFDDVGFARASFRGCFDDRATLCRSDACRHRYHHLWLEEVPLAQGLADVVAKHRFRNAIVGDNTIFHRAVRDYFSRCAAHHFFGLVPYREYFIFTNRNSYHRGFIKNDALARYENEDGRRAEVDAEFGRK